MTPELSRRVGRALGTRSVTPQERSQVATAVDAAGSWADLPPGIRALVEDIELRPPTFGP
jgi:hypothetical protein